MAYSLKTQHVRLIRAHERLRELYRESLNKRRILTEENKGLKRELREARSELTSYERASYNTLGKLLSSVQYAVNHLYEAGDKEAAEKLSNWMEEMRNNLQPVANVQHLIEQLQEWIAVAESRSDKSIAYMKTRGLLDELAGLDGE